MSDAGLFTFLKESLEARFTLRYFDEDWHELVDLPYEAADAHGILTAIHQWMMVRALGEQPLGVRTCLREATSLNLEVNYE